MYQKKPDWLKVKIGGAASSKEVQDILAKYKLNTVCKEANCPNRIECFGRKTATFMILGSVCSRNCTFCNVTKGHPEPVDPEEPMNLAKAAAALNLKHVVITSVTRDDLEDGGASHFASVIHEIRKINSEITIEVLIPDFKGNRAALEKVIKAKPEIINHNVETCPELYREVRPMAVYKRSLELIKNVKEADSSIITKSGFMLGLGETEEQITEVLRDLRSAGCDAVTIGQYLPPSKFHHALVKYVTPEEFKKYEEEALSMGFKFVASSPLVRSSYHAERIFEINK